MKRLAAVALLTASCATGGAWSADDAPGFVGSEAAIQRAMAAARQCGMRRLQYRRPGGIRCTICERGKAALLLPDLDKRTPEGESTPEGDCMRRWAEQSGEEDLEQATPILYDRYH